MFHISANAQALCWGLCALCKAIMGMQYTDVVETAPRS